LVYVIIQNKIWMVYPVSCTALCYVTVKKLGWSIRIFGGPDPPTSPVVAPMGKNRAIGARNIENGRRYTVGVTGGAESKSEDDEWTCCGERGDEWRDASH